MGKYAQGTLLKLNTTGSTYVTVAEITTISVSLGDNEEIDTTNHDTSGNYREFISGFSEGAIVDFEFNFLPGSTTQDESATGLMGVKGTTKNWRIVLPASASTTQKRFAFSGYLRSLDFSMPHGDKLSGSGSIKINGAVTFEAEA